MAVKAYNIYHKTKQKEKKRERVSSYPILALSVTDKRMAKAFCKRTRWSQSGRVPWGRQPLIKHQAQRMVRIFGNLVKHFLTHGISRCAQGSKIQKIIM